MVDDIEAADISEKLKPVLRFLKKLTETPTKMTEADAEEIYDAGWDSQALYHAVSVCGVFTMSNLLIQGLGIPPHNADTLKATVMRLTEGGYASTAAYIRGK